MTTYMCDDGTGAVEIQADSFREAAEEYVAQGDYLPEDRTYWVSVVVSTDDDTRTIKVDVDPVEPPCTEDTEHDWRRDSVCGYGGGVVQVDECHHCGLYRTTNTWATDRFDGQVAPTNCVWYDREGR